MKVFQKDTLFSKDPVNSGRQPEVDLGKAVLILCLAFVHVTIECSTDEALSSGLPYFWDSVLGGPFGAPMFMMAMGIGVAYSKKNSPRDNMYRGCKLFLLGMLLNVFSGALPLLIGYFITGDSNYFLTDLVYLLFEDDIMQFAGLAFFLMGIFGLLKLKPGVIWIISLGMNIIGRFFNAIDFGSLPLNIFFSYFLGVEDADEMISSAFPLMLWMIVFTSGYVFGTLLIHARERRKFYLRVSPVCAVFTVIYLIVGITGRYGMFGDGENCFYHLSLPDVICCITASFMMLGIYSALLYVLPEKLLLHATNLSKRINSYYCIHWVLIGFTVRLGLYVLRGTTILSLSWTMLLSAGITVAAIYISDFWEKGIKPNLRRKSS